MQSHLRYLAPCLALSMALAAACSNSSSSSQPSVHLPRNLPGERAGGAESQPGASSSLATLEVEREQKLARLMSRVLETEHLRRQPLDDSVSEKAFRRYLEQLDPGKLFLLVKHVSQFEQYARKMDDQMKAGHLALAHEGSTLLSRRLGVVRAMIESILAQPFDFARDESVETDPDKEAFCDDDAALRERWRKTLKLQTLARVVRMEEIARARAEAEAGANVKGGGTAKSKSKSRSGGSSGKPGGGAPENPASDDPNGASGDPDDVDAGEEIPATFAEREAKVRKDLAEVYVTRFTRMAQEEHIDRVEAFVNAIAGVYDPHTSYLPPQRKEDFDIQMSGSLEGIGALLSEDEHYIRVAQIVPGSASWRHGELEVGDLILAVAQDGRKPVDIGDMPLRDVVRLIRGKKGTEVTLTVQKANDQVTAIAITRDVVSIESTYAKGAVLEHRSAGKKVGYIYLPSFYGNTRAAAGGTPDRGCTGDVRKLLGSFADRKIAAVILDMRGNGGGLLDDAQDMSGLFIKTGPIVQTRTADGRRDVLSDDDPGVAFRGDVVVLVDRFSASAAEILAAALQDYGRAVVIGTGPTHGKGTVQVLVSLDALSGQAADSDMALGVVKLTRMQFFRVNGASTQRRGVIPDIVLPDMDAHFDSGERSLDHSIPWSQVEPLEYTRWPDNSWNVADLAGRSRARQARSSSFAAIARRSQVMQARRENTVQPLELDAWRKKREAERKELESPTADPAKWPRQLTVSTIDYDGSLAARARPRPADSDRARSGKPRSQVDAWHHNLARDPWVEESVLILGDMARK